MTAGSVVFVTWWELTDSCPAGVLLVRPVKHGPVPRTLPWAPVFKGSGHTREGRSARPVGRKSVFFLVTVVINPPSLFFRTASSSTSLTIKTK